MTNLWDRALPHARREALFGGRGAVRIWNLAATPVAPFTALLACELDPRGLVGAHVQEEYPEVVIVVEGRGEAKVAGEPITLAPGATVFLPLGETLALENASASEPLRYIIVKARG
jgi:mannose-6-phosphate isomerase-like protein (cupin superfamily)